MGELEKLSDAKKDGAKRATKEKGTTRRKAKGKAAGGKESMGKRASKAKDALKKEVGGAAELLKKLQNWDKVDDETEPIKENLIMKNLKKGYFTCGYTRQIILGEFQKHLDAGMIEHEEFKKYERLARGKSKDEAIALCDALVAYYRRFRILQKS